MVALANGTSVTLTSAMAPQTSWFKFDPPTTGGGISTSTVELSAWADLANGVGAMVYLVVNGVRVGEPQYVTAGRWSGAAAQNLTFTFDTPETVTSLAISPERSRASGSTQSAK